MKNSLLALLLAVSSCSTDEEAAVTGPQLQGVVAAQGGSVVGVERPFQGVVIDVPAGATDTGLTLGVTPIEPETGVALPPLPGPAERIGAGFRLTLSAKPSKALTITLPADLRAAAGMGQDYRQVKVWRLADDALEWKRLDAITTTLGDGALGSVAVSVLGGGVVAAGVAVEADACTDCQTAAADLRPLPGPALGPWLSCEQGSCAALVATADGVAGVVSSEYGAVVTAPLSAEAASRLWPARGLTLLDDDRIALALSDRLALLSADAVIEIESAPLAVLRSGPSSFWAATDVGGVLHLESRGLQLELLSDSATSLATPPLSAMAGVDPLVVGGGDRVLIGEKEVRLTSAQVYGVTEHGLSLDADGLLRTAKGLPMAGKLVGAHFRLVAGLGANELIAAHRANAGVWWVTSNYEPPTPADEARFEASEVLKLSVMLEGEPAMARALAAAGGRAAMLTRKGELVLFSPQL